MLHHMTKALGNTACLILSMVLCTGCSHGTRPDPANVRFTMTDDGGWCWFQDERAIVDDHLLIVGSVASGYKSTRRAGNVEVHWRNLVTGESGTSVLHERLDKDDHAVPALILLPDGRYMAVYTSHGHDRLVRMRRSIVPGTAAFWGPETTVPIGPGASVGVTYSNVYIVEDEPGQARLYDFYRGEGWNPNAIVSENMGGTWEHAGSLMKGPGRPYVKYASDGRRIHFVATEQHPRDADNSLWHGYLENGYLYDSKGVLINALAVGSSSPDSYTQIFEGRADAVAWPADLSLDKSGFPVVVYTVQVDGEGKPRGQGGRDHRFRYARWTGDQWLDYEIGRAGRRLYPGEDDYTGLAAIDPNNPRIVYVSTDEHPGTGDVMLTERDGQRRREIFEGRTWNGGRTWEWKAITSQSDADNIRPIAVPWGEDRTILLWLHGTMKTYTNYSFEIQGLVIDHMGAAKTSSK